MKFETSDAVFQSYAFFSGILVVKMLLMSLLTALQRFIKQAFANPEDSSIFNCIFGTLTKSLPVPVSPDKFTAVVTYTDPDVERVRRAHLNDLENIPLFFIIGLIYCFTNPPVATASLLFKIFTGARIAHTLVYAVVVLPQPSRGLAWVIGQICIAYMTFQVIAHFA